MCGCECDGCCLVVASGFLCSLISWWWKEWRGVCNNTIIQSEITGAAVTPAWVTPAPLLAFTGTHFSTLVSVCRVSQYETSASPFLSNEVCWGLAPSYSFITEPFFLSVICKLWMMVFFCSCASFLWSFQTSTCDYLFAPAESHDLPLLTTQLVPLSILSVTHQSQPDVEFLLSHFLFYFEMLPHTSAGSTPGLYSVSHLVSTTPLFNQLVRYFSTYYTLPPIILSPLTSQ